MSIWKSSRRDLRPDRPGRSRQDHHRARHPGPAAPRRRARAASWAIDSMRDVYAIRERIGYIAQQFALPGDLTVLENMRFFANLHGMPCQDQKTAHPRAARIRRAERFYRAPGGQLSGGMKKKLALACSLIHEPQVVLLDEPTLGVDPVSRREFWNLLGNLRAEKGLTIFVCTPYMDEAERCNRVGLIYDGRLIAMDTPAAIKAMVPGRLLEFTPAEFVPARRPGERDGGRAGGADLRRHAARVRGRRARAPGADRSALCRRMASPGRACARSSRAWKKPLSAWSAGRRRRRMLDPQDLHHQASRRRAVGPDPGRRTDQEVWQLYRRGRGQLQRADRGSVWLAGSEWGRQNHHHPHAARPAQTHRGPAARAGLRPGHPDQGDAGAGWAICRSSLPCTTT